MRSGHRSLGTQACASWPIAGQEACADARLPLVMGQVYQRLSEYPLVWTDVSNGCVTGCRNLGGCAREGECLWFENPIACLFEQIVMPETLFFW